MKIIATKDFMSSHPGWVKFSLQNLKDKRKAILYYYVDKTKFFF